MIKELSRQRLHCQLTLGDNKQSGSILVDTMNQAWPAIIARHLGKIPEVIGQRINKRAGPVLVGRVYYHPSRLVDYDQIIIFENNVEWNVFGFNIRIAGWFWKGDRDDVAGMYFVIWLDRFLVYPNKSSVDSILHACSRNIGQSIHQKLVDPQQCLTCIGNDSVVLEQLFVLIFFSRVNCHISGGKGTIRLFLEGFNFTMRRFIAMLLFATACGGTLSDEQRKKIRENMDAGEIRKVTDAELTEAAFNYGRTISAILERRSPSLDNVKLIDSLEQALNVKILLLQPSDTMLLEVEQQIIEAYTSGSGVVQLADNIQRLSGDTLLYTKPVVRELPDGSSEFEHALGIHMPVRSIVLSIPD